jgi:hypothetical protein
MSFRYTKELLDNALTYDEYRRHIDEVLDTPAADEKTQKMIPYYEKNAVLMDQFINSYKVNKLMLEALRIALPVTWLVITEGWCGDAAYASPLFRLIEKAAHGKIELKFVLKNQHPGLMDANLTNGGRTIPKLIVLNEHLEEVASWGPKPEALQEQVLEWKASGYALNDIIAKVDNWYNEDKTLEIQHELREQVYEYSGRKQTIERLENLNRLISSI